MKDKIEEIVREYGINIENEAEFIEELLNLHSVTNRYLVEVIKNKRVLNHTFAIKLEIVEGYKKLFKEDYPDCEILVTKLNGL